jgi:hypothetical protein
MQLVLLFWKLIKVLTILFLIGLPLFGIMALGTGHQIPSEFWFELMGLFLLAIIIILIANSQIAKQRKPSN